MRAGKANVKERVTFSPSVKTLVTSTTLYNRTAHKKVLHEVLRSSDAPKLAEIAVVPKRHRTHHINRARNTRYTSLSTKYVRTSTHHALHAGVLADLLDNRRRLECQLTRGYQHQHLNTTATAHKTTRARHRAKGGMEPIATNKLRTYSRMITHQKRTTLYVNTTRHESHRQHGNTNYWLVAQNN